MSAKRYPEEFKLAAVRQITEGGYAVSDVARRLDVISQLHIFMGQEIWTRCCGVSNQKCRAS